MDSSGRASCVEICLRIVCFVDTIETVLHLYKSELDSQCLHWDLYFSWSRYNDKDDAEKPELLFHERLPHQFFRVALDRPLDNRRGEPQGGDHSPHEGCFGAPSWP